ncbi:WecB/TagA/CpsF family glycosyltransferase [Roseiconus nitratireducens]|uniref:WecB/TagA/CpsF family glycosyltransferase n=1 Tax=Roseiconus nitratireducens TaxID=2605748 RepID=A0A5M6DFE8_9BACT|nr:WecB/TagA/CpsF family glycosyltransferase [Roseiconus nitratireducens]KAA5546123.1 WecB/TagA/CpsF family glycosyltransferase [Roseiconus nitratireducens]
MLSDQTPTTEQLEPELANAETAGRLDRPSGVAESAQLASAQANSARAALAPPRPHVLWSIPIDPVTMQQAIDRIFGWIDQGAPECRLVVTPNVDHVVQLHRQPELRPVYRQASLTLADGWPLVTMSRVYGMPLPQRVAGSDLLPGLCAHAQQHDRSLRLFLLGGFPGVAERAAKEIHAAWPAVRVVDCYSPPFGFETDAMINSEIQQRIASSDADVLVVGLGFPKQEKWLAAHRSHLRVPVALAVGATIDFLAGEQTRAPRWVQQIKMEWLHRLASNPRRLARRYAQDAFYFPLLCLRQWRSMRK